MIHSLATKKYNLTYGRVVSVNLGNIFEEKFTVKTQHSCVQYDTTYLDDSAVINVSSSMTKQRLSRVYGEPERNAADIKWSKYYVENDSVVIKNVEEAPWYNNMEATIVGYNHDLMRFNVVLGGRELAFMPHNIFSPKVVRQSAPVGEGVARTATRAKSPIAPSAVDYSVGQSVEVLWRNNCGGDAGKARKITWHVGKISAIHHEGSVVASYDVEMPQSFVKQPGVTIFDVKSNEIQPKRKRGKRERAPQ